MFPADKQSAVTRALQTAFGVQEFEDIRPLSGGLSSAYAFQIRVKDQPYLLKIMRAEVLRDPKLEFTCMQTAARAGLAPRVWYASLEDRLLITDFIQAQPFPTDMAARVAPLLRRVHALPGFPRTANYLEVVHLFSQRFQAANLLPESATRDLFSLYAKVQAVYPWREAELVASHNDVKPQNMVFDGQRLWLVDWESAFINDPYVDLSIAGNFFIQDETQESVYLEAYLSQPPSAYQSARFFLMRQAVSMFYVTLLLLEASRAGLAIREDQNLPDFRAYHQELILDRVDMRTPEDKLRYGLLHFHQALHNMRSPRFAESLARVRAQANNA